MSVVISNSELREHDTEWIAREYRGRPGSASVLPLLFPKHPPALRFVPRNKSLSDHGKICRYATDRRPAGQGESRQTGEARSQGECAGRRIRSASGYAPVRSRRLSACCDAGVARKQWRRQAYAKRRCAHPFRAGSEPRPRINARSRAPRGRQVEVWNSDSGSDGNFRRA